MSAVDYGPLVPIVAGVGVSVAAASLVARDARVKYNAKTDEIERRVTALEATHITAHDFLAMSDRLDEIRDDVRGIVARLDRQIDRQGEHR